MVQIVIDHKTVVALGVGAAVVILSVKMTAEDAKNVAIHAIDTCKALIPVKQA